MVTRTASSPRRCLHPPPLASLLNWARLPVAASSEFSPSNKRPAPRHAAPGVHNPHGAPFSVDVPTLLGHPARAAEADVPTAPPARLAAAHLDHSALSLIADAERVQCDSPSWALDCLWTRMDVAFSFGSSLFIA
ncbi:hypothetical protein DFH09DRAFT_1315318 [Mycena vulgaris]|nr:hypothetical protein DFH09DRAFT_1315318 [Mycena vulgaris]